MTYNIETSQEPDGNWVAKVHSLPGFRVYGWSEEETLASASVVSRNWLDSGAPTFRSAGAGLKGGITRQE